MSEAAASRMRRMNQAFRSLRRFLNHVFLIANNQESGLAYLETIQIFTGGPLKLKPP